MARLNRVWRTNTSCKSLVISILSYGCETRTLLAGSEKKEAFENNCLRKSPTWSIRPTTGRSKINFLVGPQEPLLATVERRKLAWFGHVTHHDNLSKTILRGTLESGRRRGRQRECWVATSKSGHPYPCQNRS